ncbi:MAG: hypothetical protein CGW95_08420 [Phenylobacterium zucineum]|nr:MAG: hypothetical protein CGW95_08420 [Phenylobacterium zucineum]
MSRVRRAIMAGVFFTFAASPLCAAGTAEGKPKPGYWEVAETATLLFSAKKIEHRCLVGSEIAKFLNGPSNRHYDCTYPIRSTADGRIHLKGSCTTKKGQIANVMAQGSYSPVSFKLVMAISTKIGGIPLSGKATTEAKRLGDSCPAEALRSDEAKAVLGSGTIPE